MTNLFSEFTPLSEQEWLGEIEKSLKGKPLSTLEKPNFHGIPTKPFYTANDLPANTSFNPKTDNDWRIQEQILIVSEEEANQKALNALAFGAQEIVFINTLQNIDFTVLFKDILLDIAPVYINRGNASIAKGYHDFISSHYTNQTVTGGVIIDPIGEMLIGNWDKPWETTASELIQFPHHLAINAVHYGNAGANIIDELSLTLGHLAEYLEVLKSKKLNQTISIHINMGIGSHFFFEIAKGRALITLVNQLLQHFDFANQIAVQFNAVAKLLNKSIFDNHTNMLRLTTEGLSAGIAGYDSCYLPPFDACFRFCNDSHQRISRNIQHLLKEESYINQVIDAASGSYYLENITKEFCQAGWSEFLALENKGGLISQLEKNLIQTQLRHRFDELENAFNENRLNMIGVNQFPNNDETIENIDFTSPFCIGNHESDTGIKALHRARIAEQTEKLRLNELKLAQ